MPPNEQQAEAWNGLEASISSRIADRYDLQLEPFTRALLERASSLTHKVVLDVGCGSGATTLTTATTADFAAGIDLSRPLVELAMRRASVDGALKAGLRPQGSPIRRADVIPVRYIHLFPKWQRSVESV